MEKQPLTAVYASHLERAIETAWRVARPHGLPINIRRTLADTHTGDFTAKTIEEITKETGSQESWKIIVEKPSEGRLPNGESLLEMQARVVAELERICAAYPDPEPPPAAEGAEKKEKVDAPKLPPPAVIAVVMHADPIKAALAHYLGMPFDNFQRLGTAPASLSTIMVHGNQVMVVNINQVPY